MLTAADILKPDELPVHKVNVPEWGGEVYVATLRADERDVMETACLELHKLNNSGGIRARIVATCLCDESGKRLFANNIEEAATAIGQKSALGVQRVFNVASKLNGISSGDLEELEKN